MNKKRVIITFIMLATMTTFSVFVYLATHSNGKVSDVLSQRSIDFILGQQQDNNSVWQQFSLKDLTPIDDSKIPINTDIVTPCFAFKIPFKIIRQQLAQDCDISVYTESPKSTVVAFSRDIQVEKLEETPDVQLRLNSSETYTQETSSSVNYQFMIFKNNSAMFEKTAFYYNGNSLFAITIRSNYTSNLDKQFNEIVESIELY